MRAHLRAIRLPQVGSESLNYFWLPKKLHKARAELQELTETSCNCSTTSKAPTADKQVDASFGETGLRQGGAIEQIQAM